MSFLTPDAVCFGAHTLLEGAVGTLIFFKGSYPYEDKAAIKAKTTRQVTTARYHASGLLATAVLGGLVLGGGHTVKDDVGLAAGLTLGAFHALCSTSAATGLSSKDSPLTWVLNPHTVLAAGFGALLVLGR